MTKIAIVILNWNGKSWMEKFLPGVLKHLPDYAQLIVADNKSTDDSISFLEKTYPQIELIINEENDGFAKGYNDALKKVKAEYYVLLNSDIEIKSNWIEPIIDFMESNSDVAICQPKILDQKKSEYFEYAGAAGGFIDYLGFPFCRGRIFQELEKDNGQFNDTKQIFWCTGAAMFIRSEVYHELKGFDESFFAHMEEIDLCWRAQNLGYKVFYKGDAEVFHVGGGTLPKHNPRKAYLNFRNNLFMLVKNWPSKNFYPKLLFKLILDGIAAIKFLIEGDFGQFKAVFNSHIALYKNLRTLIKQRKSIPKTNNKLPIYNKSIVLEHFVKGKSMFSELDNF